jgi:hypothetical protein
MSTNEAIILLRLTIKAKIALDQDKVSEVKTILGTVEEAIRLFQTVSDEELIQADVPVCICADKRGWSTCGDKCHYHPPEYICLCGGCGNCTLIGERQACQKRVAYMRMCHRCDPQP